MALQFQGIYKLVGINKKGPQIQFKRFMEFNEILAKNTADELRDDGKPTAYLVNMYGAYLFRDDERGDHYTQYKEAIKPFQEEHARSLFPGLPDFSTGINSTLVSPLGTDTLSLAGRRAIDHLGQIAKKNAYTMRVNYEVEPRAKHFNVPQWQLGAGPEDSQKVRSAIVVTSIELPQ